MCQKKGLVMKNGKQIKTAAVLATYNHEPFAYEAIESISTQVDEVIAIDDYSSDGTKKELERAQSDFPNLRVILNKENIGVSASINKAIKASSSDFIFLSAGDDLSLPHRVASQIENLKTQPETFFFSEPEIVDQEGHAVNRAKAPEFLDHVKSRDIYFRLITQGNHLCATSAAFSKQKFLSLGGFEEGLEQLQDWALWLKLAATGNIHVSSKPVSKYRKHLGNLSGANYGRREEVLIKARVETAYILSREIDLIASNKALASRIAETISRADLFRPQEPLISDSLKTLLSKKIRLNRLDLEKYVALHGTLAQIQSRSSAQFFKWLIRQSY